MSGDQATLICHPIARRLAGHAPRIARRVGPVAAVGAVHRPRPASTEWACYLVDRPMPYVPEGAPTHAPPVGTGPVHLGGFTHAQSIAPGWLMPGSVVDRPGVLGLTTQAAAPGVEQPTPVPAPGPLEWFLGALVVVRFLLTTRERDWR